MKENELYTLDSNILEQMKHVYKINLNSNPIIVSTELTKVSWTLCVNLIVCLYFQQFKNIKVPGVGWVVPNIETDSSLSDTGSEDWEESISSSEMDFISTDSETDDDEVLGEYLPKLSKYLFTY